MDFDWKRFNRIASIFVKTHEFELNKTLNCPSDITKTSELTVAPIQVKMNDWLITKLLWYMFCKLGIEIKLESKRCNKLNNQSILCLNEWSFDENLMMTSAFVPIEQDYRLSLLSAMIFNENQSYFSYIKLFSKWIWLAIILLLVIMVIFIFISAKCKIGLAKILCELIRLLLAQSSKVQVYFAKLSKQAFLLIFLWILCSSILTKCFTSLLLKTYFIQKSTLTVNTLEDIVSDPDLFVTGKNFLLEIKSYKPKIYEILYERLINYENKVNIDTGKIPNNMLEPRVIKDVLDRKLIILVNRKNAHAINNLFSSLMVSKNKWIPSDQYIYVTKSHPFYHKLYQMLKFTLEGGLWLRKFRLNLIVSEIYANTGSEANKKQDNSRKVYQIITFKMAFRGTFVGLLIGYLISIFVLMFENFFIFSKHCT